jgi:3-oxoacyl-[acyl-carrier protein] reductase
LAGYLKTLAAEVASDDVTVNMLLPGRIATERTRGLDLAAARRRGVTVDVIEAESRASIPAGRYGSTEEFGATAAFLCSGFASYVTGTALRCDGGLVRSL